MLSVNLCEHVRMGAARRGGATLTEQAFSRARVGEDARVYEAGLLTAKGVGDHSAVLCSVINGLAPAVRCCQW